MEVSEKNSMPTVSLVLGIIAMSTSLIPFINNMSFILGIIGLIFGIIAIFKKTKKIKSIISIVLCILAIVITLNVQQSWSDSLNEVSSSLDDMTGENTNNILGSSVDVELGDFEVEKDSYFTNTKLMVKVTNKLDEKKSFSIHIEAVDENGTRLSEDYIYANNLNAGQSQNFETFKFVESDKVPQLKDAIFKILEVSMY